LAFGRRAYPITFGAARAYILFKSSFVAEVSFGSITAS